MNGDNVKGETCFNVKAEMSENSRKNFYSRANGARTLLRFFSIHLKKAVISIFKKQRNVLKYLSVLLKVVIPTSQKY